MRFQPHEIDWTTEKSKRLWDYYGANPHYRTAFFGYIAGRHVARRLFADAKPSENARILDFSCGRGDIIAACLPRLGGAQVLYATDFSATYVDAVNQRFAGNPRFRGAELATALPTPYADGHFEIVLATEVIEHLAEAELDGMLAECRRLLMPGGRVFFTTPNEENCDAAKQMCPDCGCIYHKWQHVRVWSAATLQARMEAAGFLTQRIAPVAWQSWQGKLLALVRSRRIQRDGLIYVGRRPA